jgi:hypothetical protein
MSMRDVLAPDSTAVQPSCGRHRSCSLACHYSRQCTIRCQQPGVESKLRCELNKRRQKFCPVLHQAIIELKPAHSFHIPSHSFFHWWQDHRFDSLIGYFLTYFTFFHDEVRGTCVVGARRLRLCRNRQAYERGSCGGSSSCMLLALMFLV